MEWGVFFPLIIVMWEVCILYTFACVRACVCVYYTRKGKV